MRWVFLTVVSLFLVGCSTTREITFTAIPADAELTVDGMRVGKGPVTQEVTFKNAEDVHKFTASRKGFKNGEMNVLRDDEKTAYQLTLKPQTKKITLGVTPAPAVIFVDGKPLGREYVRQIQPELEFTVDAKDKWIPHKIRAERPNFAPAEIVVGYEDPRSTYVLNMEPLKKDITINSNPPGAEIWLDGESLGKAPAVASGKSFPFDIESGAFNPRTIKASKPGYDPVEKTIGWDNGQTDYTIDLLAKNKTVRITTEPANCTVELEGGTKLPLDSGGTATAKLEFPPVNEEGQLKTYKVTVSKKTADSEWYPQTITVGWDNGKQDYSVVLKEILTRPVPLTSWEPTRTDDGWTFVPKTVTTLGYKDTTEGKLRASPQQLTRLPKGSVIDTLAVSPDGASVLFTTLIVGSDKNDFRSQMMTVKTDGSGGSSYLSDGKSLDLTPSYTPDGTGIVFSSNRAGRRMSIWQMSAVGNPGITQLTTGDTNDLFPTIDSDPRPRLYYQTMVDTRPDPRLFMTQLGTTIRTELTQQSGRQPRVSPRADQVVFTSVNERTGKRDLYLMGDKGGQAQNITNTPDVDEFDPSWNKDGSMIAFASDAGLDSEKIRNYDIWIMDVAKSGQPVQVTANGSYDDQPSWDNANNIYFRSNRGGDWNIWKIAAK